MAIIDNDGNWINRNGRPVPSSQISKVMKRRDKTVEQVISKAMRLQAQMIKAKAAINKNIENYISFIMKESDADVNPKGNIVLTNFSGTAQVEIVANDKLEYDEQLAIAYELMIEYVLEISSESKADLRAIIDEAFNVGKRGKINTHLVLRLAKLEINHPNWKKASKLIFDSIQVSGVRKYMMIRTRANKDAKWKSVDLTFSSLEVE